MGQEATCWWLIAEKCISWKPMDFQAFIFTQLCVPSSILQKESAIRWIKDTAGEERTGYHIGIAHGSAEGLASDFDVRYYPMTTPELQHCRFDLWLLGHTHVSFPLRPGPADCIFYAGLPEPDDFTCTHEGAAWIIEIADNKTINPRQFKTGHFRFMHDELEINSAEDLAGISVRYAADEYRCILLKLKLRGAVPLEDYQRLPDLRQDIEGKLFYVKVQDEAVTERITLDRLNREFTEGSFLHRLLTTFAQDQETLQIVYDLIREVRT